jgi:transposase-like protein
MGILARYEGRYCRCEHGVERRRFFQRPPFRSRDHHSLRALVSAIQAQFSRSRGNDGRTRIVSRSYDDHALGPSYVPEFEKRWNRFARQVGGSWRVDETYVKIKGRWTYLHRAVDKAGRTVDFPLRAKRDVAAAKAFFRRAFASRGRVPHKATLDGYQASHRAARDVLAQHRGGVRIKLRLGPMPGFKRFRRASVTIAGIELMHRTRKGQLALSKLRTTGKTAPEIWTSVLAA